MTIDWFLVGLSAVLILEGLLCFGLFWIYRKVSTAHQQVKGVTTAWLETIQLASGRLSIVGKILKTAERFLENKLVPQSIWMKLLWIGFKQIKPGMTGFYRSSVLK